MDLNYLPMIAMRGLVTFPDVTLNFDVGRDKSVSAIIQAMDYL